MKDTPSAPQLLDAIARALADQVLPATEGGTRHAVRVAANLCRIVGRELAAGDGADVDARLAELLGDHEGDLAAALDARLQSDDPSFDDAIADWLYADVVRRVDIAKPGYRESEG